MSRTFKSKKPVGYDYMSRRCSGGMCLGYGPVAKWITKNKERTRNKGIEREALRNPEDAEGRFPGE